MAEQQQKVTYIVFPPGGASVQPASHTGGASVQPSSASQTEEHNNDDTSKQSDSGNPFSYTVVDLGTCQCFNIAESS